MEYETHAKKADYFYKQQQEVHIKVKSGLFYNGYILHISADFIMLNDRRLGETPIFFQEMIDIVKYEVRDENKI